LLQRLLNFAVHLRVEAVELVGAIEAEQGDAGLDGKQDVFEVHGREALTVHARRSAGSLLDRRGQPVLPEYSFNVIHKCNDKIDLVCLVLSLMKMNCSLCWSVNT
jgi:hypothetical protein